MTLGHDPGSESQPLVSVIVPAWNAQATLLETLESAAAQTYSNIEIVIIDDGSTDDTAAIAADFCSTEPRARLVRQENRGLAAARNRGCAESKGSWIAPLDADDLWHPTKIEKQVRAALAAPQPPGYVYCWYQHIDEQGFILASSPQWLIDGSSLKRLTYQSMIHTVLLARAAVESVGGYDESLRACEDAMIQLRIARSYPVAIVPEHLMGYRKRPDSMSRDTELIIRSWKTVLQQVSREGADIPPGLMRWMDAFFYRVLAEDRMGKGAYLAAIGLYARALRGDPLRWGSYAGYRIMRTVTRLLRGRRVRHSRQLFLDADPRTFVPPDPDELKWLAALLDKFELSRLKRLAASEIPIVACSCDQRPLRSKSATRSGRSPAG